MGWNFFQPSSDDAWLMSLLFDLSLRQQGLPTERCEPSWLSPRYSASSTTATGLGRLSLCGLQERPSSFQRQTIAIGVYRLRDKIRVKGPCALAVAGSLGRLRGSVESPEAAGLISQVRFERLQRLLRSITFEQHLSKQLTRGDDGTRNYWISFDGILAVGGRPQQLQCFFPLALRMGHPGGYHLAMDVDLHQPIIFEGVTFRLDEIGTQLLQPVEVVVSGRPVASACRAERAHKHEDGFGLRELGPRIAPSRQGDCRRLVPTSPLGRIACRYVSQHVGDVHVLDVDILNGGEFVEHFLRSVILPGLQVAVDQEAHGEEFPEEIVDVRRRAVGGDRFLPQSESSENVRWNLQRVRRCRGYRWVAACHVEAAAGYMRVVI